MKFVTPSVEIWEQDVTNPETLVEAMWAHIARCVRVCYQVDKPKNNETEEEYVRRVIFRNSEERLANHYSVLETHHLVSAIKTHFSNAPRTIGNDDIALNQLIAHHTWLESYFIMLSVPYIENRIKRINVIIVSIW